MAFKRLGLASYALVVAAMLAPAAASAQYAAAPPAYYAQGYGRESDRDFYARRGYGRDRSPLRQAESRQAEYRERRTERCGRGDAGTILGAIAGGLLGNAAVGRHGNRTVGTLAGAGAGGLVGNAADRDCD